MDIAAHAHDRRDFTHNGRVIFLPVAVKLFSGDAGPAVYAEDDFQSSLFLVPVPATDCEAYFSSTAALICPRSTPMSARYASGARMRLALLSVNIAQPRVLAYVDGQPVLSAIGKQPVAQTEIRVLNETLEGDRVADPTVHGGADKAVYAYPSDNWAWWQSEHGLACRPGAFGENLTVSGADETQVRIGDRFQWGEAVLEVSQPRQPCFKFALHTQRPEAGTLMTIHARCGWYFRVIEAGLAPVAGSLARVVESDGPSVREAFIAAMHRRASEEERRRMAAHPAMSRAFRATLLRK